MIVTKPGLYPDMAHAEYASDPCPAPSLNQSGIPDLLDRSPYHFAYRQPRLNPYGDVTEETSAQYLGQVVHRLALGRGREISTIRHRSYRDPAAQRAKRLAIDNGRLPILESELVRALDMAEVLKQSIADVLEGAKYQTEVPLFWIEKTPFGDIWCRGCLDIWCKEKATFLDPKALRITATPGAFGRSAADAGYDIQIAFYRRGLDALFPKLAGRIRGANLVLENYAPYACAPMEPDGESLAMAESDVKVAIYRFAECLYGGSWPSYPRKVQTYSTPAYRQQRALERAYNSESD